MKDTTIWGIRLIARFWRWGVKTFIPYMIPGFVILSLAKAGALLQNNLFIFAMIVGICVIIGLVAFNKLKEPYYAHVIGAIGFALLLQTTLMGPGIIGSDIHGEYHFYYRALDGWDATFEHPYNVAIGSTVIAPFLTNVFRIPGYWIYKVIFPLCFAFVPLLLYFVFRKEFGSKSAFFAALFFIIVPTWSMEMIALPRQMLGELMLALCLFIILVTKWRLRIRVPLLVLLGTLGAMFHYVMGPLILLLLGVGCFLLLFFKRRVFPVKWLSVVIVLLLISNVTYYGLVGQGTALKCITGISTGYVTQVVAGTPWTNSIVEVGEYEVGESGEAGMRGMGEADEAEATSGFLANTSPLMRTAWGLDFMDVDFWSKVFRIFQYLTQLSIIVGFVYLVKERKRYSAEYLCFCVAAMLLLTACVFIPRFAAIINATRMYHLTLFLLAPVFILGAKAIFRNFKVLTVCLIVPYFLFTSGFIFEATQQTDISRVNMPYSISLSNHRVDMVGVFTSNDIAVRDWAVENIPGWIYADTHNYLLLAERVYMTDFWYLAEALKTDNFEGGKYIFLSERNNQTETVTFRPREYEELYAREPTSGMRISYPYEEVGLDKVISEGRIIYRQGDAFILEIRTHGD